MTPAEVRPILALETTGSPVSVALLRDGRVTVELRSDERAGTVLHGLIAEALRREGLRPQDLGRIAAARGPGSFTGLRVGLAAAGGLGLAAGVVAVGVETTRALALASGRAGRVAVAVDGGQGRVFVGVHDVGPDGATPVDGPLDASLEEAVRALAERGGGVVRGSPPGLDALLAAGAVPFEGPAAGAVARIAAVEADPSTLSALYARAPAIRAPPGP